MKNPWEWDENDLLQMVNTGAQESVDLEFKASGALQNTDTNKDEISKDVSAFANSAGGTLIYGMMEDKNTHLAAGLDAGSDPKVTTKEWLEQVINSKIQRRIDGVRIQQIALTTTNPGRVAYVVYVPSSTRAAHQAANKKFYKRYNYQVLPMEEYEIRDVSRRDEIPDLTIEILLLNRKPRSIDDLFKDAPSKEEMDYEFQLDVFVTNTAVEPANYAVIDLFFDAKLKVVIMTKPPMHQNEVDFKFQDESYRMLKYTRNWSIPNDLPIFNEKFRITRYPIIVHIPKGDIIKDEVRYLLGYMIKSPRMPVKQAFNLLHLKDSTLELSENHFSIDELYSNYHTLGL
jgi:Schlafen, AlbA_2